VLLKKVSRIKDGRSPAEDISVAVHGAVKVVAAAEVYYVIGRADIRVARLALVRMITPAVAGKVNS
jgi:hypothetical protein